MDDYAYLDYVCDRFGSFWDENVLDDGVEVCSSSSLYVDHLVVTRPGAMATVYTNTCLAAVKVLSFLYKGISFIS